MCECIDVNYIQGEQEVMRDRDREISKKESARYEAGGNYVHCISGD